MLSYAFINSHSQVSDSGPKGPFIWASSHSTIDIYGWKKIVDPDQLASDEDSWSASTLSL